MAGLKLEEEKTLKVLQQRNFYGINLISWPLCLHLMDMFMGQQPLSTFLRHVIFNEMNFIRGNKVISMSRNLFPREKYKLYRNCLSKET